MAPFLQMRNIVKRFPGVVANDHVDLTVETGEIHALLGENGAGKTTLMNILYGLYRPDEGEIYVQDDRVEVRNPNDAIAQGIGMIHQEFMLIPRFTVVENTVMGLEDTGTGPLLDLEGATQRLKDLSSLYGLEIDPDALVERLSVGVQQRVEILKLLYRKARLLILDEPTGVLTPQEAKGLFRVLRSLTEKGHTVIFITHKLNEVMDIADRVTVLRDGKLVATLITSDTSPRELARMMVGREVLFHVDKTPRERGKLVLQIEDLRVIDSAGHPRLRGLSLEVYEGEVVGLAGVDGNGQSELAEAAMGLRSIHGGHIRMEGVDVTHTSPAIHHAAGMAYVPADRRQVGSVEKLSIAYNSILGSALSFTTAAKLLIDENRVKVHAQTLVKRYDVRAPSIYFEAGKLSGGNLQKMVLGRELMRQPRLLLVEQPTRGLDVGATEYIHRQLLAECERGTAILLISAELEEIMSLSDRIAVIYRGEIMGVVNAQGMSIEAIGLMMGGTRPEDIPTEEL